MIQAPQPRRICHHSTRRIHCQLSPNMNNRTFSFLILCMLNGFAANTMERCEKSHEPSPVSYQGQRNDKVRITSKPVVTVEKCCNPHLDLRDRRRRRVTRATVSAWSEYLLVTFTSLWPRLWQTDEHINTSFQGTIQWAARGVTARSTKLHSVRCLWNLSVSTLQRSQTPGMHDAFLICPPVC